jgi:hypothetical protein
MAAKKENRGGKRPGAGRKKTVKPPISELVKARFVAAAERLAKEKSETLEYKVLSMIWEDKVQDTTKVGILKAYLEALVVRETKQEVTKREVGPNIYLPKTDKDPAKVVVLDGGIKK